MFASSSHRPSCGQETKTGSQSAATNVCQYTGKLNIRKEEEKGDGWCEQSMEFSSAVKANKRPHQRAHWSAGGECGLRMGSRPRGFWLHWRRVMRRWSMTGQTVLSRLDGGSRWTNWGGGWILSSSSFYFWKLNDKDLLWGMGRLQSVDIKMSIFLTYSFLGIPMEVYFLWTFTLPKKLEITSFCSCAKHWTKIVHSWTTLNHTF